MPIRPLGDIGEELFRWGSSAIARVPTGYSFFDSRTGGGVATGEVAVMLARSGVGKTWFLVNVAANNPKTPTLFFSLEMHARYLLSRLTAVYTGTPTLHQEEEIRATGSSPEVDATVEAFPLLMIDDEPARSFADMVVEIEAYTDHYGMRPKLVLIDYLELVKSFGLNQSEAVEDLGRSVKRFAREMDVAVVILQQANRGEAHKEKGELGRRTHNEGHIPLSMTDARYGGEQHPDYMWGMYRPALDPKMPERDREYRKHDLRFQFLKTRTGGGIHRDGVQHFYDERTGKISSLDASVFGARMIGA